MRTHIKIHEDQITIREDQITIQDKEMTFEGENMCFFLLDGETTDNKNMEGSKSANFKTRYYP